MNIAVITLFPEMFNALTQYGVTGRTIKRKLIKFSLWNPRDYSVSSHKRVDGKSYGGGPGMVLMAQPVRDSIHAARASMQQKCKVVYLTPQGAKLTQERLKSCIGKNFIFVSGRYEGLDERVIESDVDEEWSIGDYVLSGGELPAMVTIDAIARLIPGALGDDESITQDSFEMGLLEYPHYTRPENLDGCLVPQVLLSGHHKDILRWRLKQALGRTWLKRPDMLTDIELDDDQQKLLDEFKSEFGDNSPNTRC